MNRYYVYEHCRASDGAVFYVGKGSGRRAYSRTRSEHWKRVVAKHGLVVNIVKDEMPEVCALTLERVLIARYGLDNLVNIAEAGIVSSGVGTIPVYSSEGEFFTSMTKAANRMGELGYMRCKPSKIGACCSSNGVRQAYGRLWSTEGFPDKPKITGRDAVIKSWQKRMYSSKGEVFESISEAVRFLKENGWPRAQKINIIKRAQSNSGSIYDRAWSYDGFPEHPDLTGRKAVLTASAAVRSVTLYCSNGMSFRCSEDAAQWIRSTGKSCKSIGKMLECAKGKSKSAYGYGWSLKEFSNGES